MAATAVIAASSMMVSTAPANAAVNVYVTPGHHFSGGREWKTSCEPYSQTQRCRTEIRSSGKWVFNNLTYKPSPRSLWVKNPLGKNISWKASDGSKWRTECDTAKTGRNGCRSYRNGVFNNIVMFNTDKNGETITIPPFSSGGASSSDPNWRSGDRSLNKGYSSGLHMVNSNSHKVVVHTWDNYPTIKTMYGYANKSTNGTDHKDGRAIDIMIPRWNTSSGKSFGWNMAYYYRTNAKKFGINYIIFDQKIWSVGRDSEGWRKMSDRGNSTANHKDHLHVNTYNPGSEWYRN